MKIEVCLGDITKETTDAIVNAANKELLGGGGVDGAIHDGAGEGLLEECKKLNGCPVGRVRITGAYNLNCNYIIHTTGPRWKKDGSDEECKSLLTNCYWRSLVLAKTQGLSSISFPCISTGVYQYPKELAAKTAIETVRKYFDKFNGSEDQTLTSVRFVCFSEEDYNVYISLGIEAEKIVEEEAPFEFVEEDEVPFEFESPTNDSVDVSLEDIDDETDELTDEQLDELLGTDDDKKKNSEVDEQEELKQKLEEANKEYRETGETSLTDEEYDYLLETVDDEQFKNKIGVEVDKNKIDLPVKMGSMNKIKTDEEIDSWKKSKNLSESDIVLITPKFDGMSLLVSYEGGSFNGAYTRGNGEVGQDVTEHLRYTKIGQNKLPEDFTGYLVGEAIMKEKVFEKKYKEEFKNPRNMVSGILVGRKEISKELYDIDFIAFNVYSTTTEFVKRSAHIGFCNKYNNSKFGYLIPALTWKLSRVNSAEMQRVFDDIVHYQCDGVIMELNDCDRQLAMGLETNSLNPSFARAWKPDGGEGKPTKVIDISWSVSKSGYVKPVVQIETVDIAGVSINNVTGNNAKFIKDNNIGKGSIVTVIRSGDVIPKIINVVLPSSESGLCSNCPSCDSELDWNKTKVELVCPNGLCDEKVISQNVEFFKIMGVEEVGEGVVKQLYEAGYKSIPMIISTSQGEFEALDGFGERKAEIVYSQIHSKLTDVPVYTLQHASNLFKGLGERKLKLLEQYDSLDNKPQLSEILAIDGYSDKTADVYLKAFEKFWNYYETVKGFIHIKEYEPPVVGALSGKTFVFTGGKPKNLIDKINSLGGKEGTSVSNKAFAVITKEKGSGSSKEKKALDLGIHLWNWEELEDFLGENNE